MTKEEWRIEVAAGRTIAGYDEWVRAMTYPVTKNDYDEVIRTAHTRRGRRPSGAITIAGKPVAKTDHDLQHMSAADLRAYAISLGSDPYAPTEAILFNRVKARQCYLIRKGVLRSRKEW